MDNQTAIGLLTLCAVVTVMILLGGFLVIRVLRTSVFGIASMVLRSVTDPDVEEDEPERDTSSSHKLLLIPRIVTYVLRPNQLTLMQP